MFNGSSMAVCGSTAYYASETGCVLRTITADTSTQDREPVQGVQCVGYLRCVQWLVQMARGREMYLICDFVVGLQLFLALDVTLYLAHLALMCLCMRLC